jgi:hypothetical protein
MVGMEVGVEVSVVVEVGDGKGVWVDEGTRVTVAVAAGPGASLQEESTRARIAAKAKNLYKDEVWVIFVRSMISRLSLFKPEQFSTPFGSSMTNPWKIKIDRR